MPPKKNNPVRSIALYWPDFKKTLSKSCSSRLYASSDTFWVQNHWLRHEHWSFKCSMKSPLWLFSKQIGQFRLERCQKKREVINYKILRDFSWKLQKISANKGFENLVSKVLWSELDSFFLGGIVESSNKRQQQSLGYPGSALLLGTSQIVNFLFLYLHFLWNLF